MSKDNEDSKQLKNEEFHNLMKNLTFSFIDALDKPFVSEYGSWYDRIKVLTEDDIELLAKILLIRSDLNNKKVSQCLVNFKKTIKYLTDAGDFSKKSPHSSTKNEFTDELILFLATIFNERERLLREKAFSNQGLIRYLERFVISEYLKYERYLYDNSASNFVICPLENYTHSDSTIDFGDGLLIRKIKQDELHHMENAQLKYGDSLISYPEFVIYLSSERNFAKDLVSIISSFRFLKNEKIGLKRAYFGYAFPFRPWNVIEIPSETELYIKENESIFSFNKSEIKDLVEMFLKLDAISAPYLEVAKRRFNLAYQRDKMEDKFIDYFVSLESLFSTKGERTEVTYRISTRASKILAQSLEERKTNQNRIKKLYGYRSGIVHGEQINLRFEDVEEVEDIVRLSLKWFVNRVDFSEHNKIIDEIDFTL